MTQEIPPQTIQELLHDLEFVVRQNISVQPPRVLEALERLELKRRNKPKKGESRFPPPSLEPPKPQQIQPDSAPAGLFDQDEYEVKW